MIGAKEIESPYGSTKKLMFDDSSIMNGLHLKSIGIDSIGAESISSQL